ncbi:MAG: choice-of-anchor J domain-containing protein [Prevotellaceae bacterium]|jgi:PKD repeat protein|nr:choice-of-anchor J domain-containing protein [Prevotellaceae bacterium]
MKKNQLFKFLLLLFAITWLVPSFAQIKREGTPPSFAPANKSVQIVREVKSLEKPDIVSLKAEDKIRAERGLMPRISQILPANYTMENSGEWLTLETGERIWQLRLKSSGAIALSLLYDRFYLPEGSKLFIYSANKKHVVGAFTSADNPKFGPEFSTEMIAGDEIILEYVPPTAADKESSQLQEDKNDATLTLADNTLTASQALSKALLKDSRQPVISISGVAYVYNNALIGVAKDFYDHPMIPGDEGSADACMININCPEGGDWQNQKKGVAATLQYIGTDGYLCSGTILNNTAKDRTPYFLMAYHCGEGASTSDLNRWQFYFHFERTGCDNSSPRASYRTAIGAQRLVESNINGGSDGLLLRLNTNIPDDWDIYFNGWNRSNTPLSSGAGIHHPAGDLKKISFVDASAISSTWNSSNATGATNAHWRITWATVNGKKSVTQGGSSGSPLFDENGLVVGSLSGGNGTRGDECNTNTYSLYGKLWWHWDQSPNPNQHMSKYLDPIGSGVTTLDGMYSADEVSANFTASDTNIYVSQSIEYRDISALAATWEWSFDGGTPSGYIGRTPPAIQYNTAGVFKTTLIINKGTASADTAVRTITVSVKEAVCSGDITIGDGTATAQFPLGLEQQQTFSAAIYTVGEIGLNKGGVIKQIAWSAESATTETRTLYIYLKEVDETIFTPQTWVDEIAAATLVYQNTTAAPNVQGWNTLSLSTPFTYTGTKNLKVLVRSLAANTTGYYNSNCNYTTITSAHQQWTSAATSIPSTNGTVNDNRPNIRFTVDTLCGAVPPVADFRIQVFNTLFSEKFDAVSIPAGWTIEKPGASANQWSIGNLSGYNFNTVDPTSIYSIYVNWDGSDTVDTWLKSPAITIPAGSTAKLSFYLLWGMSYSPAGMVTFYVSDDNGATWVKKWASTYEEEMAWRQQVVDLSEYAGKTVKLAWQYYGLDLYVTSLDNVLVYSEEYTTSTTINVGETVSFIDRSAGPPLSWEWTLPGATPATSTATNLTATYTKAGTYDVSLTVTSHLGTNTKTFPGMVIVKSTPMSIQWRSSSQGYTTYPYSGQLLPEGGGKVQLTDITAGGPPTSWAWELPGATPTSATKQEVEALYPAGAASYSVKLEITTEAEKIDSIIPNYVKITGISNIWNIAGGENPIKRYQLNATSPVNGVGGSYFSMISERFESSAPGVVSKVQVYTDAVTQNSGTNRYMTVALYSDVNGLPGTLLSPTMSIPAGSITNGGYNTITFPTPVGVPKAFHVVVGTTNANNVRFWIPCVGLRTNGYSTVRVYYSGSWRDVATMITGGFYTSLNIVPEFAYTKFKLTSTADTVKKKNIDPDPETVTFTTDAPWTATAPSWITLSAASGTGTIGTPADVTLTFTVAENQRPEVREGAITINAGTQAVITVLQGGTAPSDLTAVYNDENKSVKLTWGDAIPPLEADAFDDIEAHMADAIDSPGSIGWSYIDGDGTETGVEVKMAFMVMNAIDWFGNISYAHSGSQILGAVYPYSYTRSNDDWLVSPKLDFGSTVTFSFWARSATTLFGAERMRVAYSTTGKAENNFTHVLTTEPYVEVPATWTKYSYTIPADAKYVAINCVSDDAMVFLIDDIFIGTGTAPASAPVDQALSAKASTGAKFTFAESKKIVKQNAKTDRKLEARKVQSLIVSSLKDAMHPQSLAFGKEAVIRWDDGKLNNSIGAGGGDMEVAAKFEPSDLKDYKNASIKSVEIAIGANVGTNMKLNIRQGGTIVYSQPISGLTADSFHTIELKTPVLIDVKKDLMVGYVFTHVAGEFVAGCDGGPAVAGKGDLVSLDGSAFEALSAISTINANWNIAVTLVGGKQLITYNVYRDGKQIAKDVDEKEYEDTNPPKADTACYVVTAVYDGDPDFESTESDKVCVYSKGFLTISVRDTTREEANSNPTFTAYIKDGLLPGDNENDILSLVKFATPANALSPAGTYVITPIFKDLSASTYAESYVFVPAPGVLTITTFPTVITQQPVGTTLCEGDAPHIFTIAATGLNIKYQWQRQVNGAWTNVGTEIITSGTSTSSSLSVPATRANAAIYRVLVNGRSDKPASDEVVLRIGLPWGELIAYPWSDVPTVNNNSSTNGGYSFVAFQWLRDGAAISGATNPYIQIPKGTTASYALELTTSTGAPLGVCSFTPPLSTASLLVYPNPVTQGTSLTLQSAVLPKGSVANIYNSTGALVKGNLPLSGVQSTIDVTGLTHGLYVLQVVQPDGTKETINIVVN